MKRLVVILALAALVAGLIASPVAAAQPMRGVYTFEWSFDNCGELIHVTGEIRYVGAGYTTPKGEIYKWQVSGVGTAVDSQGNEYRYVEQWSDYYITPSQQNYPYATYTSHGSWRLVGSWQGEGPLSGHWVYHLSPNGVDNAVFHSTYVCPE